MEERIKLRRTWVLDEERTVEQLLVMLASRTQGVVTVSRGAHFAWETDETEEEFEKRMEWKRRTDKRQAEWERETYKRLKAKFE